jgi:hypothetical protein
VLLYTPNRPSGRQLVIYRGQMLLAGAKPEDAAFTHVGIVNAGLDVYDATPSRGTGIATVEQFAVGGSVRVMRLRGISRAQQQTLSTAAIELVGDFSRWQIVVDLLLNQVVANGSAVLQRLNPDWERMARAVLNGGDRNVFYCSRLVSLAYSDGLNVNVGPHAAVAMPCHFSSFSHFDEVFAYW